MRNSQSSIEPHPHPHPHQKKIQTVIWKRRKIMMSDLLPWNYLKMSWCVHVYACARYELQAFLLIVLNTKWKMVQCTTLLWIPSTATFRQIIGQIQRSLGILNQSNGRLISQDLFDRFEWCHLIKRVIQITHSQRNKQKYIKRWPEVYLPIT